MCEGERENIVERWFDCSTILKISYRMTANLKTGHGDVHGWNVIKQWPEKAVKHAAFILLKAWQSWCLFSLTFKNQTLSTHQVQTPNWFTFTTVGQRVATSLSWTHKVNTHNFLIFKSIHWIQFICDTI